MLFCLMLLFLFGITASANASDDEDVTPVPICNDMPASAVISLLSGIEAKRVCRAMGLLVDVRVKDIREFSKSYVVLRANEYPGSIDEIVKQLVTIVRLRGLGAKSDRWDATLNIVLKTYQAFNGVVTPIDIINFLLGSGSMAKTLSDEGLTTMLILIKIRKQDGG
jgi:hypothetical protein